MEIVAKLNFIIPVNTKVKVRWFNEVGTVVGYYNDSYIILWDEEPTDSDFGKTDKNHYRAHLYPSEHFKIIEE